MEPLTGAAIGAGSEIVGGIGDYLTGGADREWEKKLRRYIEGLTRMGGITDQQIQGVIPFLDQSLPGVRNKTAGYASRRWGVDSGRAGGEITKAGWPQMMAQLAQMKQMQIQENAMRPFRVGNLMAGAR